VLQTPGNGDRLDAAAAVYGTELAAELLPIDDEGGPAGIEVLGLAGSPAVSRASRNYVSLFVNRRWIRHRSLLFAIAEAYQGMLPVGRHPVAIVEVRLPAEEVDVNVHPTKAEVRFRDERTVFAAVQRAVRRTLSARAPTGTFDPGSSMLEAGSWGGSPSVASAPAASGDQPASPSWREQAVPLHLRRPAEAERATGEERPATPASSLQLPISTALPLLRPVGQVGNTYIIAEGPDGMYLIDQHAAHERVLYERFLAHNGATAPERQPLLQPATLELVANHLSLLQQFSDELAAAGLEVEPFGEGSFLVRAVPPSMAGGAVAKAVVELLDLLARDDGSTAEPRHRVAASLACHAAVRAGHVMSDDEQRELLRLLEASEQPRTCPHGRPTMIHVSADALARQFRRK
jgi:DNA mismatch repair protein MutL